VLVSGMAARQRRPVLGDVLGRPQDTAIVDLARDLVVRADDVEVALAHAFDQHVDDLVGRPRAGRLLAATARRHAGEGRARDQQMRRDTVALLVAQAVRQRLGQHLHTGLADIVGGVAGRAGDALFGAGVDDGAGRLLRQHGRAEDLHAVDHAPQVDAEQTLPALVMIPGPAARRGAGVVHQHGDVAERRVDLVLQALHALELVYIVRLGG